MKNLSVQRFVMPDELYKIIQNYRAQNLLVDSKDRVWIGTMQGLIVYYPDTDKFVIYQNDDNNLSSIVDDSVTQVFEDSNGDFWIGTYNGFCKVNTINNHEIEFIQYKQNSKKDGSSILSNQISSICEVDGKLYLGMESGVSSYDLETEKFKLEFEDFGQYTYSGLAVDNDKNIWATTTDGLLKLNLKNNQLSSFGVAEGLLNKGFLARSAARGKDGDIYFGLSKGILGLHPKNIVTNDVAPPVFITDVKTLSEKGEKNISGIEQTKIDLSRCDYLVEINFAALNFNYSENNKYAYRLKGFDEKWIYTTSDKTTATYTNLDPGNYFFEVKACLLYTSPSPRD